MPQNPRSATQRCGQWAALPPPLPTVRRLTHGCWSRPRARSRGYPWPRGTTQACDISQDVCPYNIGFSRALAEASPYAVRPVLGGMGARTPERGILGMTPPEFIAAFKGSPMRRMKRRDLKRNAGVVPGDVGRAADVPVLEQALEDPGPPVREHAAWALRHLRDLSGSSARSCGITDPRQGRSLAGQRGEVSRRWPRRPPPSPGATRGLPGRHPECPYARGSDSRSSSTAIAMITRSSSAGGSSRADEQMPSRESSRG
jgi:hypothetical protein